MANFITSFSDGDVATNALITLTLPATFGVLHNLFVLEASYGTGGVGDVYVEINGVEVFRSNAAGGVNTTFNRGGLFGLSGQSLQVFLDAGGPFVVGTLKIHGTEE